MLAHLSSSYFKISPAHPSPSLSLFIPFSNLFSSCQRKFCFLLYLQVCSTCDDVVVDLRPHCFSGIADVTTGAMWHPGLRRSSWWRDGEPTKWQQPRLLQLQPVDDLAPHSTRTTCISLTSSFLKALTLATVSCRAAYAPSMSCVCKV